jgi:hypothetical protein
MRIVSTVPIASICTDLEPLYRDQVLALFLRRFLGLSRRLVSCSRRTPFAPRSQIEHWTIFERFDVKRLGKMVGLHTPLRAVIGANGAGILP